jgi:hypothetical protein
MQPDEEPLIKVKLTVDEFTKFGMYLYDLGCVFTAASTCFVMSMWGLMFHLYGSEKAWIWPLYGLMLLIGITAAHWEVFNYERENRLGLH